MQRPHRRHLLSGRRRWRGVGLFDALIALAILAFGLLGMTRMQTSLMRQTTETQTRAAAVRLADELLSTALIDNANAACYTHPAAGVCGLPAARTRADAWKTNALAQLPGSPTATSTLAGGQLTVRLTWTGKTSSDARTLEATTDVR